MDFAYKNSISDVSNCDSMPRDFPNGFPSNFLCISRHDFNRQFRFLRIVARIVFLPIQLHHYNGVVHFAPRCSLRFTHPHLYPTLFFEDIFELKNKNYSNLFKRYYNLFYINIMT